MDLARSASTGLRSSKSQVAGLARSASSRLKVSQVTDLARSGSARVTDIARSASTALREAKVTDLLTHTAASAPDAGAFDIHDLPASPRVLVRGIHSYNEDGTLLQCSNPDDCLRCERKRRRLSKTSEKSFTAYPTQPTPVPSKATRPPRPRKSGLALIIAQLAHLACCCKSRRKYQIMTRYRYHQQKKPYSAISVHVENLTSETYDEDDLAGTPDLIEVIRLQGTGPTEAARALRKKLKYGNVHRQLRALTILDGILQNGGTRIQRTILGDGPLLERLRIAAVDPISDVDVRAKCKALFSQWVASSKDNPGLEGAKALYNQLPKKNLKPPQQRREQSKVLRENEEDARRDTEVEQQHQDDFRTRSGGGLVGEPSTPRKNSLPAPPAIGLGTASTFGTRKVKKDKKSKSGKGFFNLEREKPNILQAIAASSVASTNLNNALKLVNREDKRVSDDPEVMARFETCKTLRRQILRYIQLVETDEFLGGLIHANEELVGGLMAFEVLDKSVDDDSDSELEEAQHLSRLSEKSEKSALADKAKMKESSGSIGMAGLSITSPQKPPRPRPQGKVAMPAAAVPPKNWRAKVVESDSETESEDDEDDEENPFGDKNAMKTPQPVGEVGRKGYSWKEV